MTSLNDFAGRPGGGRSAAVFAGISLALGLAYSAGVLFLVAARLSRAPTPTAPEGETVIPPIPLLWSGLGFLIAVIVIAVTAGVVGLIWRFRLARSHLSQVEKDYKKKAGRSLSAHERRRAREVATWRALHDLIELRALRIVGWLVLVALGLAVAGIAGGLSGETPMELISPGGDEPDHAELVVKWGVDVGSTLAGLLPIALAGVAALVYRRQGARRAVGVIWDIATFWPRAGHPLAPPCYAERAVPELITRVSNLLAESNQTPKKVDGVILAGHSQGSTIAVAVLLQLDESFRKRTWLLTFGSQLNRLYGWLRLGGGHRAIGDCLTAYDLLCAMTAPARQPKAVRR